MAHLEKYLRVTIVSEKRGGGTGHFTVIRRLSSLCHFYS